jgi:hypothetical protein
MVEFQPNRNLREENLKPRDSLLDKGTKTVSQQREYTESKWFSGPEYIPREHSIDVKGFGKNPNLK